MEHRYKGLRVTNFSIADYDYVANNTQAVSTNLITGTLEIYMCVSDKEGRRMKTNLRIGEVLMERNYITQEQMEQALAYQKEHREKLKWSYFDRAPLTSPSPPLIMVFQLVQVLDNPEEIPGSILVCSSAIQINKYRIAYFFFF